MQEKNPEMQPNNCVPCVRLTFDDEKPHHRAERPRKWTDYGHYRSPDTFLLSIASISCFVAIHIGFLSGKKKKGMNIRILAWIWLLSLATALTGTTASSASKTLPSNRWRLFRQKNDTLTNTTEKEEESVDDLRENRTLSVPGFSKESTNQKDDSPLANDDSPAGDDILHENGMEGGKQDEESSSQSGRNTTETKKKLDNTKVTSKKSQRRGPFGFFKPLDQIKLGNVTTSEEEAPNNTTAVGSENVKDQKEEDMKSKEDNDGRANSTTASSPNATSPSQSRYIVVSPTGKSSHQAGTYPQSRPVPARYTGSPTNPSQALSQIDRQTLFTAVSASIVNSIAKLWIVIWLAKRLSAEDEMLSPRQHFRWECLNDRYSKDQNILNNVLNKPPLSFSSLRWGGYLRKIRSNKNTTSVQGPNIPTKSVVVVDITPSGYLEIPYLTDVVNFLVTSHTKVQLGPEPEIVLLVESPGGAVTTFGLAASQIGRLKQMGLNVTICVDNVAASGGYMMATQATKLLAAPFAMLGSIGVMAEGLNFNKVLNKYGVQPIVLKAGENKNRLNAFGPVTDEDLETETKRMEEMHEAFVDMCLTERPALDSNLCDGTVLVASQGIERGLVDRVITSEEYIWECMQDGAHILKLHKATQRPGANYFFFRALDLLPHLKERIQRLDIGKVLSATVQGLTVAGMFQRAMRYR